MAEKPATQETPTPPPPDPTSLAISLQNLLTAVVALAAQTPSGGSDIQQHLIAAQSAMDAFNAQSVAHRPSTPPPAEESESAEESEESASRRRR